MHDERTGHRPDDADRSPAARSARRQQGVPRAPGIQAHRLRSRRWTGSRSSRRARHDDGHRRRVRLRQVDAGPRHPRPGPTRTAGAITFEQEAVDWQRGAGRKQLRRNMQMVFQNPYSSLNPRSSIGEIIALSDARPRAGRRGDRRTHRECCSSRSACTRTTPRTIRTSSAAASGSASTSPAPWRLHPKLVICDEAVAALDKSVQAQVLNLAPGPAADPRADVPVHQPRPERRRVHERPRGGDVPRPDRRDGRGRPALSAATAPVHPGAARVQPQRWIPNAESTTTWSRASCRAPQSPSGCRFRTRCPHAMAVCAEVPPAAARAGRPGTRSPATCTPRTASPPSPWPMGIRANLVARRATRQPMEVIAMTLTEPTDVETTVKALLDAAHAAHERRGVRAVRQDLSRPCARVPTACTSPKRATRIPR